MASLTIWSQVVFLLWAWHDFETQIWRVYNISANWNQPSNEIIEHFFCSFRSLFLIPTKFARHFLRKWCRFEGGWTWLNNIFLKLILCSIAQKRKAASSKYFKAKLLWLLIAIFVLNANFSLTSIQYFCMSHALWV